jgi:energy-coupling factor transporter ATP-binding protein EcfA2
MTYDNDTKLIRKIQSMPIEVEPIDTVFYIFAIRVRTDDGEIRRKLGKDKLYYLLKGFDVKDKTIIVDSFIYNRPIYDFYMGVDSSKPHVSISAIVGENGSGKSSLIEFEIRLINNLAAAIFGEYSKEPGWEHLHYVNNVDGDLYYLYNDRIYKLMVNGRHVELSSYKYTTKQNDGSWVFDISEEGEEKLLNVSGDYDVPFEGIKQTQWEIFEKVLSRFFYTIVLNQSVYAYNTQDYSKECNSEKYEVTVRKCYNTDKDGRKILYSTEDKCWLNGLFHKNDGYQIPLVLSPYRFEGNYDINRENDLAYERLISLLVLSGESFKVINGHLQFNRFLFKKKDHLYDLSYVHHKLGYTQFVSDDFETMKKVILETWITTFKLENVKFRDGAHIALAMNYLVYKTLKIASTYEEYDDYRKKYLVEGKPFELEEFRQLVRHIIKNQSHVTNKLYRTFAFLIWDIFDDGDEQFSLSIDDVAKRWADSRPGQQLNILAASNLIILAVIPPPIFEMSIELLELKTKEVVPFETLSSGEKQQAYTISSLLYHLNNLDSVGEDTYEHERIVYPRIHLVLEEVELYYHPQLQKEFVKNLLNGLYQINFQYIKWIDIRIVTHSPFVLSDIPKENVLTLRKTNHDVSSINCFGANIHDMLRNTFFMENGTIGDFASWLIKRIAQCLRVHRWMNGRERAPKYFPSLEEEIPKDFDFLKGFKLFIIGNRFNTNAFEEAYGKEKLLCLINMIEEPVIKRVLLDDYHRTFPDDNNGYKKTLIQMVQNIQKQLDELND